MTYEIGKSENKDLENFRAAVFHSLSQIDIKLVTLWNMIERIEHALNNVVIEEDRDEQ